MVTVYGMLRSLCSVFIVLIELYIYTITKSKNLVLDVKSKNRDLDVKSRNLDLDVKS
jgi:hypothetical protein